jgi:DNA polymerase/3'-5' exonuclease PolX
MITVHLNSYRLNVIFIGMKVMPIKQARKYAGQIREWLSPYCERIEIAGSVRRECPACQDIDLVCIPRLQKGLNLLRRFLFEYVQKSGGKAHWRNVMLGPGCYGTGPQSESEYLLFLPKCQLDLYVAGERDFVAHWIRATGPNEHVQDLERRAMSQSGHWSARNELRIGAELVTPRSEEEFYRALGLGFLPPKDRSRA